MTRLALALLALLLIGATSKVEIGEDGIRRINGVGPYFQVSFLVVKSTTSYSEALEFAKQSSERLAIPLDLRGLILDPAHGLTRSRENCADDPLYPYPCYVARGRFDHGRYISIERSDAYDSFQPGLFVVISASGKASDVARALPATRGVVRDAYIKTDEVYHGCMH